MKSDLQAMLDAFEVSAAARRARRNPPGSVQVDYRVAGYQDFRQAMIAALEVVTVTPDGGSTSTRPLAGANLDARTDWMIALIDAWAIVGDVLTFYQERIANEGYLGTALEQISIEYLSRTLGARRGATPPAPPDATKPSSPAVLPPTITIVSRKPMVPSQLGPAGPVVPTPGASSAVSLPATTNPQAAYDFVIDPGAAAITDLAFTLTPSKTTGGKVLIRAGTAIRSHMADGSMPLTFETGSDLDARIEYNAMPPVDTPVVTPPSLTAASVGLRLQGTATTLRSGSSILVIGTRVPADGGATSPYWLYGTLVTVEPNQALGYTLVTWSPPAADGSGGLLNQTKLGPDTLESLTVFGFGRTLSAFGHNAQPLSAAPLATQISLSDSGGVSWWDPNAKEDPSDHKWRRLLQGLPVTAIESLAVGNDGTLWIGGVFGVSSLPPGGDGSWTSMTGGLGSAEVISLTVAGDGSLWAGTATGQVFRTLGRGQAWSPISGGYVIVDQDGVKAPVKTALPRTPVISVQPFLPTPKSTTPLPPAALAGTGLGAFGNYMNSAGWLTDNTRINDPGGTPPSTAGPYTASPLVDLKVLEPGFSFDAELLCGYAIAATSNELVAYPWSPFDPPYVPTSPSPPAAPYAWPGFPSDVPLPGYGVIDTSSSGLVDPTFLELTFLMFPNPLAPPPAPPQPGLLVLTSSGALLWNPNKPGFDQIGSLVPQSIAAVPLAAQSVVGGVAVGTDGEHVWALTRSSDTWAWQEVDGFPGSSTTTTQTPSITTMIAAGQGGMILAAAPLELAEQWPDFSAVQSDGKVTWVDADSKSFDVPPGSWVFLDASTSTNTTSAALFQLQDSAVAYRSGPSAYGQPGRTFRLFIQDAHIPPARNPLHAAADEPFDPRSTAVLASSFQLGVYQPVAPDLSPVAGVEVELAGIVDGLDAGGTVGQAHDPRPLAFSGQQPRLCVTMSGGLWATPASAADSFTMGETPKPPPQASWEEQGLGFRTITALLDVGGELWVGASSAGIAGVFARTAGGPWVSRSNGLPSATSTIHAFAASGPEVLVATDSGAASWDASTGAWKPLSLPSGAEPLSLLAAETASQLVPPPTVWWAGTASSGLLTSSDGVTFKLAPNTATLVGVQIVALALAAPSPTGAPYLMIGTPQGLYRYDIAEADLSLVAALPVTSLLSRAATLPVTALSGGGSTLLIGTAGQGVWLTNDVVGAVPGPAGLATQQINALAGDGPRCYAGTGGEGVYGSADAATWAPMPIGAPDDVRALLVGEGSLFAGAAERARLVSDSGVTTVDLTYSNPLALPPTFKAQLDQGLVTAQLRSAFAAKTINLPADAQLTTLDGPGRWLLASQGDASAPVYVLYYDAVQEILVIEPNKLPVLVGPWPSADTGGFRSAKLALGDSEGDLLLGEGQWTFLPPQKGDPAVSEVKRLRAVVLDYEANVTRVTLDQPLEHAYARATTQVSANVVRASQGETVNSEIMGNGNSAIPSQSFTLRRAPLTFLPVPPPEYRRSTLTVKVDNVEWQEVPTFGDSGPQDLVYTVAIDHEGRATVTFGDGTSGARLPTGNQNVIATYRVGLGAQGDLATGALNMILSPPPGVKSVTNPIPATMGVDPDDVTTVRTNVPLLASTLNCVVTLADHEDLATSYPGVDQAKATSVRATGRTWVQISVVFDASVPAAEIPARVDALTAAVAGAQAAPGPPVSVAPAVSAYFGLDATVQLAANAIPEVVVGAVFDALFGRWSLDSATIGEDVLPSAIEAVVQAVSGVEGSRVSALARTGEPRDERRQISASPAHYDDKTKSIVAAEILVINPNSAVTAPTLPPSTFVKGGVTLVLSGGQPGAGS